MEADGGGGQLHPDAEAGDRQAIFDADRGHLFDHGAGDGGDGAGGAGGGEGGGRGGDRGVSGGGGWGGGRVGGKVRGRIEYGGGGRRGTATPRRQSGGWKGDF